MQHGEKLESISTSWSQEQYWRPGTGGFMSTQKIHSRGMHAMNSSIGALSQGQPHLLWLVSMHYCWRLLSHSFIGFIRSELNPADPPSRLQMTKSLQTLAAATARRQRHRHIIARLRDQIVFAKNTDQLQTKYCSRLFLCSALSSLSSWTLNGPRHLTVCVH